MSIPEIGSKFGKLLNVKHVKIDNFFENVAKFRKCGTPSMKLDCLKVKIQFAQADINLPLNYFSNTLCQDADSIF